MPRFAQLLAFALMAAASGSAFAQTQPTTAQATALETQINAWLLQTTAGAILLPPRTIQMQAEGDHYLVRVPIAPFGEVQPADAAFTAKARPLDGTRWAVDDQHFPRDLTLTTTQSVPDAPDAKDPTPSGHHPEVVTVHAVSGEQDLHGVFDPSYATPTNSGGTIASLDLTTTMGARNSSSHFGLLTAQTSTQPTDPAHVNVVSDTSVEGYSTKASLPDGSGFNLEADRMHVAAVISGLAHDQMVPFIRNTIALAQMLKDTPDADNADGPTPAQKAALRQVMDTAHGLLTGSKLDESLEGVKFDYSGAGGSLRQIGMSFGAEAPQETLSADMTFTMDGLEVGFLPPAFTAFVPTHFSIHPTVSNISVTALNKMGMDLTAPTPPGQPQDSPPPDYQSLFANGGINVGFDQFALEIEGTQIHGDGAFNVTGPQSFNGQAQFTARGLDALIGKLQANPMLAQGVPVVIFLKGIAHTTGDQAVWQLTVNNTKVLVNGLDFSAMMAAMSK